MEHGKQSRIASYIVSRQPTRKPMHLYEERFSSMRIKTNVSNTVGFRASQIPRAVNRDRYHERQTRRPDLNNTTVLAKEVLPTPTVEYEAVVWEEEPGALKRKQEAPQKDEKVVASSTDAEPVRDDIYDTLTLGSIRVTEVLNIKDRPSSSSELQTRGSSSVATKASHQESSVFGERRTMEGIVPAHMNGAVQGSDAQAALLQASFLQSTSDDIVEIKRMLKEMQSKLQEMDVPAHGTSPPTHDPCSASERKSLRTRQLNFSAFAVSSIVCLQGIVAACLTAVLWKRGAMDHPSLSHKPYELAVTFLIIETLLAILAFFGCWSVRKKSPIMMTLTAAANSILILIQFGTLGWTFSQTPKAPLEGTAITISGLQIVFLSVLSLSLCLQVVNVVLLFTLACRYGNL